MRNPFAVSGAFVGSMVIAIALGAASRAIPTLVAVALLCLFVGVWSRCTSVAGAAAAVICAALFGDGFVEDRMGLLSWHGSGDAERLAAFAAAALVGLGLQRLSAAAARRELAIDDGAYQPGKVSGSDPLRSSPAASTGFEPSGRVSTAELPLGRPHRSTRS